MLHEELENWSFGKLGLSSHDSDGKIVLEKKPKKRKSRCPFGRKVVGSLFFRSIVYGIDHMVATAETVLDARKRDLEEFNFYVSDNQTEDDPHYRQELAQEIFFWTKMLHLYQKIKANRTHWYKQGKFPWSGVKVSTPYFGAPPIGMVPHDHVVEDIDSELTPVDTEDDFVQIEFSPVTKSKSRKRKKSRS